MTILDAYQMLNEFFNSNHVLNLNRDFKKIISITETEQEDRAAILCALKEMESGNLIKSTIVNNVEYWVLFKPLESFSQPIELNYLLAAGIASVINRVCDVLENDSDRCNPKEITDKDLKNLIFIASKASVENLKN